MVKKRKVVKHHKIRRKTKMKGLSWISVLIGIITLSILLGGFVMLPKLQNSKTPDTNSIVIPDAGCTGGDNLHLCTFRIVTITPIPPKPKPTGTNQATSDWQGNNNDNHNDNYGGGGSYGGGSSNDPYQGNYNDSGASSGGDGSSSGGSEAPPL